MRNPALDSASREVSRRGFFDNVGTGLLGAALSHLLHGEFSTPVRAVPEWKRLYRQMSLAVRQLNWAADSKWKAQRQR